MCWVMSREWRLPRRTLRPKVSWRRTWRMGMSAAHLFCFLALIRREHGINLAAGAGDDRIQFGLHLAAYSPELVTLLIHDRVDPGLLLRRQAELGGESPAEIAVARGMGPRPVIEIAMMEH